MDAMGAVVKVKRSDRGFAFLDELTTSYGHIIQVSESSAVRPCIWLRIDGLDNTCGDHPVRLSCHIDVEDAEKLRDQLTWIIDNHYLREETGV